MNIYHVYRTDENDWDQYISFVVITISEQRALALNPEGKVVSDYINVDRFNKLESAQYKWENTWTKPENVKARLIGTTTQETEEVICASFNAG